MAALTKEKEVVEKDGVLRALPMADNVTVFKGALCVAIAGLAAPAAPAAGNVFLGVAEETVSNAAGEGKSVRMKCEGRYLLTGAGFVAADVGATVYAEDDQTVTKTVGSNAPVGQIDEVISATQVWVKLAINPAPAA